MSSLMSLFVGTYPAKVGKDFEPPKNSIPSSIGKIQQVKFAEVPNAHDQLAYATQRRDVKGEG